MVKRFISIVSFFLPSGPTRALFRLAGHRIGRNARIPVFSYVYGDTMDIGNDVDIRSFVFINVGKLVIGRNTIISFGSQIKGEKTFSTGDNAFIGPHCLIHCEEDVRIGFYSGLGARCTLYTHGSFLPVTLGYPAKFARITIEDFVWTAMEVKFMPGAYVERNCILNPGLVISSRIPANSILQMGHSHVQRSDIQRLVSFSRKDPEVLFRNIVESFLKEEKRSFSTEPEHRSYLVSGGDKFIIDPESKCIRYCGKSGTIIYDLAHFLTDRSGSARHHRFLFFLRRQYGITLRTDYKDSSSPEVIPTPPLP